MPHTFFQPVSIISPGTGSGIRLVSSSGNAISINIADASQSPYTIVLPPAAPTVAGQALTANLDGTLRWGPGFDPAQAITLTDTTRVSSSASEALIGALNVAGDVVLGANAPRIYFPQSGLDQARVGARSSGSKIILWPSIDNGRGDYSIGMEGSAMWSAVPDMVGNYFWKWYAGDQSVMTLGSKGDLVVGKTGVAEGSISIQGVSGTANLRFTSSGTINYIQSGSSTTTGSLAPLHFTAYSTGSNPLLIIAPTGTITMGSASTGSVAQSAGQYLNIVSSTFTDNATAASGTVNAFNASYIAQTTLVATNAGVTTNSASTLYIAGPPVSGANQTFRSSHALNVGSGLSTFAGASAATMAITDSLGANETLQLYPPTGNQILTGTNTTLTNLPYGNGAYYIASSSNANGFPPQQGFQDRVVGGTWSSAANYNTTTGAYTGSRGTGDVGTGTNYFGELIELALPAAKYITQVTMYPRIANFTMAPKTFVIMASNTTNGNYRVVFNQSTALTWSESTGKTFTLTTPGMYNWIRIIGLSITSGNFLQFTFSFRATNPTLTLTNTTTVASAVNAPLFGALNLSGDVVLASTNPRLYFPASGSGVPTVVNRSAGTKIVLSPTVSATVSDYAIGLDTTSSPQALWYGTPSTVETHKWYAGTVNTMTLTGAGNLTVTGQLQSPTMANAGTTSLFNEDAALTSMNGATLTGGAVYNSGTTAPNFSHFTLATNGTGQLFYQMNPGTAFTVDFEMMYTGANDGLSCSFYQSSIPSDCYFNNGGYVVTFSAYMNAIVVVPPGVSTARVGTTTAVNTGATGGNVSFSSVFPTGTWVPVSITYKNGFLAVFVNGTMVNSVRTITPAVASQQGTFIGFSAYSMPGSSYSVRNMRLMKSQGFSTTQGTGNIAYGNGTVSVLSTLDSFGSSSGAVQVSGGLGVTKNISAGSLTIANSRLTNSDQYSQVYPPAGLNFLNDTQVVSGQAYGNGTYTIVASSIVNGAWNAARLFQGSPATTTTGWASAQRYNTATGAYTGAASLTVAGTVYSGEVVTITFPGVKTITAVTISPKTTLDAPATFILAGISAANKATGAYTLLYQQSTPIVWTLAARTFLISGTYTNLAIVVQSLSAGTVGRAYFALNFTATTATLEADAIDAANLFINDVPLGAQLTTASVSIADGITSDTSLVRSYPPSGISFTTSPQTISGQPYGNGSYVITASSQYDANFAAFKVFTSDPTIAEYPYVTGNGLYNQTTGAYTGSVSTNIAGTVYLGEVITVSLPSAKTITSVIVSPRFQATFALQAPTTFVIFGVTPAGKASNTLSVIYQQSTATTWTDFTSKTFAVSGTYVAIGFILQTISPNAVGPNCQFTFQITASSPVIKAPAIDASALSINQVPIMDGTTGNLFVPGSTVFTNDIQGDTTPRAWPPVVLSTPSPIAQVNTSIISGQSYANGTYVTSQSSAPSGDYAGWACWKAFSSAASGAFSSGQFYNASGVYTGSTSTTVSGTVYTGEWIQIRFPYTICLKTWISPISSGNPATFIIAASNDGITWTLLYQQSAAIPQTTWSATGVQRFPVNTNLQFSYFRFICQTTTGYTYFDGSKIVLSATRENVHVSDTHDATDAATGALTVSGGVGVGKNLFVAGAINGPTIASAGSTLVSYEDGGQATLHSATLNGAAIYQPGSPGQIRLSFGVASRGGMNWLANPGNAWTCDFEMYQDNGNEGIIFAAYQTTPANTCQANYGGYAIAFNRFRNSVYYALPNVSIVDAGSANLITLNGNLAALYSTGSWVTVSIKFQSGTVAVLINGTLVGTQKGLPDAAAINRQGTYVGFGGFSNSTSVGMYVRNLRVVKGVSEWEAIPGTISDIRYTSGTVTIANTTASTSPTSGALQVRGGAGISGNTNLGGTLTIGASTATPLYIFPNQRGGVSTENYVTLDIAGTGTLYLWDNFETSGNITTNQFLNVGGGGSAAVGSAVSGGIAFEYFSGGGYKNFLRSRHDGGGASAGNAIDFYLNTSTTQTGSSTPGTGNTLGMSVSATGVSIPNPLTAMGPLVGTPLQLLANNSSAFALTVNTTNPSGGVVPWSFSMVNNGTSFPNFLTFDRGNISLTGSFTANNTSFVVGGTGLLKTAVNISDYTLIGTKSTDDSTNTRIVLSGNTRTGGSAGNIDYIATSTGKHVFSVSNGSISAMTISEVGQVTIANNVNIAGSLTAAATTLSSLTLTYNSTPLIMTANVSFLGPPTFTTRSVGTKLVLWPGLSASTSDYAFGIESGTLWSSVPSSDNFFKWYGGITNAMTLSGSGDATIARTLTVGPNGVSPVLTVRNGGGIAMEIVNSTSATNQTSLTVKNSVNNTTGYFGLDGNGLQAVTQDALTLFVNNGKPIQLLTSARIETNAPIVMTNTTQLGAPTFTTRSAGTKLVLWPGVSATAVEYAFGIEGSTLWSSVPNTSSAFKWYAGTTNVASLGGDAHGIRQASADGAIITKGWEPFTSGKYYSASFPVSSYGLFMEPSAITIGGRNVAGKLFQVVGYNLDSTLVQRLSVDLGTGATTVSGTISVSTPGTGYVTSASFMQPGMATGFGNSISFGQSGTSMNCGQFSFNNVSPGSTSNFLKLQIANQQSGLIVRGDGTVLTDSNLFVGSSQNVGTITLGNQGSLTGGVVLGDPAHAIYLRYNYAGTINTVAHYSYGDIQFYNNGLIGAQSLKLSISAAGNNVNIPITTDAGSEVDGAFRVSGGVGIGKTLHTGYEVVSYMKGGFGQFRAVCSAGGNYGVFFRNDGNDFYLLSTAAGTPLGTWSANRPLRYNMAGNFMTSDAPWTFTGGVTVNSLSGTNGSFSGTVTISATALIGSAVNPSSNTGGALNVAGDIVLNAPTPRIFFPALTSVGAPTFGTRSPGNRLVLWPSVSPTLADYAIGIESGTLWFGVPEINNSFKWYAGTTRVMTLTGAGNLGLTGGATVGSNLTVEGSSSLSGLAVSGTASLAGSTSIGNAPTNYGKLSLLGADQNISTGPHITAYTNTDTTYPVSQLFNWSHDNMALLFDSYYNNAWISTFAGSSAQIYKNGNVLKFNWGVAAVGSSLSLSTALSIDLTTGAVTVSGPSLIVPTPVNANDAATKAYVDGQQSTSTIAAGTGLTLSNNTLSVDAAQTQITSVGTLSGLNVSGGELYVGPDNWIRKYGSTGLYWEDWGGGWFMYDPDYIRVFGDKHIYTGGQVQGGSLYVMGDARCDAVLTASTVACIGTMSASTVACTGTVSASTVACTGTVSAGTMQCTGTISAGTLQVANTFITGQSLLIPPVPLTGTSTTVSGTYLSGVYTASTTFAATPVINAFDQNSTTFWQSSDSYAVTAAGTYTGSASAGGYAGERVGLALPSAVIMSGVTITVPSAAFPAFPNKIYILGTSTTSTAAVLLATLTQPAGSAARPATQTVTWTQSTAYTTYYVVIGEQSFRAFARLTEIRYFITSPYAFVPATLQAASPSLAALIVSGGVGIAKSLYVGETGYAAGGFQTSSDENEKMDIKDLDLGLDLIRALSPKVYRFKASKLPNNDKRYLGLLGQQVRDLIAARGIPDYAGICEGDDGLTMDYSQLIAPLIKAVQEMDEIRSYDSKAIASLEKTVAEQQVCITELLKMHRGGLD